MKKSWLPTKKVATERRKVLLKKINYDPMMAAKAWAALAGVWEHRTDIDVTTVRTEAWTRN